MSDLEIVYGQDCLTYINKPIGLISHDFTTFGNQSLNNMMDRYDLHMEGWSNSIEAVAMSGCEVFTSVYQWLHDTSKRKIGLITNRGLDGGLEVALLGTEDLKMGGVNATVKTACLDLRNYLQVNYKMPTPFSDYERTTEQVFYPIYNDTYQWQDTGGVFTAKLNDIDISFDDILDFNISLTDSYTHSWGLICEYSGQPTTASSYSLTDDKNNTFVFGVIQDFTDRIALTYPEICCDSPLLVMGGNLFDWGAYLNRGMFNCTLSGLPQNTFFSELSYPVLIPTKFITYGNFTAIPFNIILTESEQYAKNYLNNGTIPPDAILYPLDWDNLPQYNKPDDSIDDGTDDESDPDNDGAGDFTGTPDLPESPTFSPSRLSNNNYYWLQAPQLEAFINWFWNDVGSISDFTDLFEKIAGLYNDLASTVLMIRFMPAPVINGDEAYAFGGLGQDSNIIVGMIEKNGLVNTLAKSTPPIIDIGHTTVPKKFNSFASYTPYAQCSLYLPYYGFLDIDMDMFTGHDIYVKAIYDYLTGTIQYLIYYENKYLVNSVVCKMAVDIPITLQSKNDRDSAIFNNVSSAVAGLMGAGLSIASGNPLGLVVGANALNSGVASAPMSVKGTIGESGAFYAPSKCKLITRFPVQQKPTNFDSIVGKQVNKSYKLSSLKNTGYTEIYNPRITFNNGVPLESEIEEIYEYLEKGVIL